MRIIYLVVAGVNECPTEAVTYTHRKVINNIMVQEIRRDSSELRLGYKVVGSKEWVVPKGIHFWALNNQGGYLGWLRGWKTKGRRRERGA